MRCTELIDRPTTRVRASKRKKEKEAKKKEEVRLGELWHSRERRRKKPTLEATRQGKTRKLALGEQAKNPLLPLSPLFPLIL